jgi:hydroxymethylbilane synthase
MILRLGTRGSALALAQSGMVARALTERTGVAVELVTVTTQGDTSTASLASLGGTGVFASALREALLAGECDFVVHSLKDLPTAACAGLTLAAVPEREDARDALCARDGLTLAELPAGARVGTGSPRRRAQLLAERSDLELLDIRGNVDTRLGKVASGEFDAVVLAVAGLRRLGRPEAITDTFALDAFPTAAGQGALAIEARDDETSSPLRQLLAQLDHGPSRLAAGVERAVLAGLEAGCAAPVGVTAELTASGVSATAVVYALDGQAQIRRSHTGPAAEVVTTLTRELIDAGAAELAPLGRD